MKEYPSIQSSNSRLTPIGLPCIAFHKYDGSNLRFEWNNKRGWSKFGTRHRLFDKSDPEFGCAVDIFMQKYSGIEDIIKRDKQFRGAQEVTCYCEFFGPYSFAGQHDPKHPALIIGGCKGNNEPKDLILFDVAIHKKGFMTPREFINTFYSMPIAKVVYEGNLTKEFIEGVRNEYPDEGVVCKGVNGKAPHGIWRVKIKTLSYLAELKKRFAVDWEKYWES
jgi:hypothetical protein